MVLRNQSLALLLELSMAADQLVPPRLEFSEVDGLHLIQVDESSSFGLGALQTTLKAFELCLQQFIVRLLCASTECRVARDQELRPQERLAHLLPYERVERFGSSRGLWARSVGSTRFQ